MCEMHQLTKLARTLASWNAHSNKERQNTKRPINIQTILYIKWSSVLWKTKYTVKQVERVMKREHDGNRKYAVSINIIEK